MFSENAGGWKKSRGVVRSSSTYVCMHLCGCETHQVSPSGRELAKKMIIYRKKADLFVSSAAILCSHSWFAAALGAATRDSIREDEEENRRIRLEDRRKLRKKVWSVLMKKTLCTFTVLYNQSVAARSYLQTWDIAASVGLYGVGIVQKHHWIGSGASLRVRDCKVFVRARSGVTKNKSGSKVQVACNEPVKLKAHQMVKSSPIKMPSPVRSTRRSSPFS
jgi:hypothetical protein